MTDILNKKIDAIADLLRDIEQNKTDIQFISDPETEYFKNYVKTSRFAHRVYWNAIKLLIIDLYKLINPKEHSSFQNLINFISTNRKKIDWRVELTLDRIKEIDETLNQLERKHLKNVETLRDKYYAHSDKNKDDFTIHLKLIDCWELNTNYQQIFNTISYHLNKITFAIDKFGDKPLEIEYVYKYDLIVNLTREKNRNQENEVPVEDLTKIFRSSAST